MRQKTLKPASVDAMTHVLPGAMNGLAHWIARHPDHANRGRLFAETSPEVPDHSCFSHALSLMFV